MKKFYISADIEGVAGIKDWSETMPGGDYEYFRKQMSLEVATACKVLIDHGYDEIVVKDAHGNGRNIIPDILPRKVKLIRGWSGHPYAMMQELDSSFDGVAFIGYHSAAGSGANPLAHSFSSRMFYKISLNDTPLSEFLLNSHIAWFEGVPIVFLSGDSGIVKEALGIDKGITARPTGKGIGDSVISLQPDDAITQIEEGMVAALNNKPSWQVPELPNLYKLKLAYKRHQDAYAASFYPGAEIIDDQTIAYEHADFMQILAAFKFMRNV